MPDHHPTIEAPLHTRDAFNPDTDERDLTHFTATSITVDGTTTTDRGCHPRMFMQLIDDTTSGKAAHRCRPDITVREDVWLQHGEIVDTSNRRYTYAGQQIGEWL